MARPRARLLPNVTGLHVGGEAQELLLHRVDLGEICRDVVVAAALAGDQIEAAASERLGRTGAAEMNYGGELLLLLRAGRRVWPVCENGGDVAVQKHRRELDGVARHDAS